MWTRTAAPIMLLIALSGCTEKVEASDPPAIGQAADRGTEITADTPPAAKDESEPRMQSPVQYD